MSVGVATTAHRAIVSQWEISTVATEMKHMAKRTEGSHYEIDHRRGFERGVEREPGDDAPRGTA